MPALAIPVKARFIIDLPLVRITVLERQNHRPLADAAISGGRDGEGRT
jgi:hypothetical protein